MRDRLPVCSSLLLVAIVVALAPIGCGSSPAAPFDTLKNARVTAFRLQNYEPPPQAAAPTPTAPTLAIPGLPPEITKWAQSMAQTLPPGLIPPGLIPGLGAPVAAPVAAVDTTPRFEGFRILGQAPVMDEKLRSELIDLFGYSKNFEDARSNCVYAEFGFSFERVAAPPADILVSMSCNQVSARNFSWPHQKVGLSPDTVKRLTKVLQPVFGG